MADHQLDYIEPTELQELLQDTSKKAGADFRVIDVRLADAFSKSHVPSAVNVPTDDFLAAPDKVYEANKDAKVLIFHCVHSQQRGPACARAFANAAEEKQGPKPRILVLKGGYHEWEKQILGVEKDRAAH
ncbi:hypothetical protein HK104_004299 [Borealophlyctis nickersoniae]|nr:hypothetical protein HK104_004299 [Borealophlyctis nickersoniae]